MRRILGSIAAAMVLIVALMVFVDTSAAFKPDVVKPGIEEPPVFERDVQVPVRPIRGPEPPLPGRNVSFRGIITGVLPEGPAYTGTWEIEVEAGELNSVEVTEQTMILPPVVTPEVGDSVHVLARDQGSEGEERLVAVKITVEKAQSRWGRPQHFRGEIDYVPSESPYTGTWRIEAGQLISVEVTDETMIHPPDRVPTVGMVANVVAFEQSDDTLWAMNITLQTPEEMEFEVELEGTIEDLPDDTGFEGLWIVASTVVSFTEETKLKGATPAISLTAEVKGNEQDDGSIVATEIKVKDPEYQMVEFEGTLVSTDTLGNEWVFNTNSATATGKISVTVTSSTTINTNKGPLAIGCWVEVKALEDSDGLVAIRIKVEDDPSEKIESTFTGIIEELPSPDCDPVYGQWILTTESVSTTVVVTPHTEITGTPEVGLEAEVTGFTQGDGYFHAESIQILESED